MNFRSISILAFGSLLTIATGSRLHAQSTQEDQLVQRARQEYQDGKYSDAERDFRTIVKRSPSYFYAQFFLGESLFQQQKYKDAIGPFEKARQIEAAGEQPTSNEHRLLIDQLVTAYGLSGNLKKVRALAEDAIRQDPDYPMNYYNLACAFAEESDKANTLANLAKAFEHKGQVVKGEQLPDPRTDDSFKKYIRDDDFIKLLKDNGYN